MVQQIYGNNVPFITILDFPTFSGVLSLKSHHVFQNGLRITHNIFRYVLDIDKIDSLWLNLFRSVGAESRNNLEKEVVADCLVCVHAALCLC